MQVTRAPRRHLSAHELVESTTACPICLAAGSRQPVMRVQRQPDVFMLLCANCRGCSASHMPGTGVLEDYYAHYYTGRDHEVTFSQPARFAKHVVSSLPAFPNRSFTRILDYGGGDGSLAVAIAERLIANGRMRSAEILVVDYANRPAQAGRDIVVRHQLPDTPIAERFDLVLASAILEHVPELHRLLNVLHSAIAPDGFFYARTPYVIPLMKIFPRLDLTYPAHVHDLGIPFWNRAPHTFGWPVKVHVSRPSVVANSLREDPLRAVSALVLKLPAQLENLLSPRRRQDRFWHLVGGWEVLFQRV